MPRCGRAEAARSFGIETRHQAKDAAGQVVWAATRTVYDALGRTVKTERLAGLAIDVSVPAAPTWTVTSVISSTETHYNALGQVDYTVGQHAPGAAGPTTNYEYDAQGRQIAEIGPAVLDPLTGETVRARSETHYAADGQVACTIANIRVVVGATETVDDSHKETTSYLYDAQGRTIRTTYTDGSYVTEGYDSFGRKTSESYQTAGTDSDPLLKLFGYDNFGRLLTVELPAVFDPTSGTMQHPVYVYGYDVFGNQTLIRDPLGRETRFTYDAQNHETSRTLPLGVETTTDPTDFIERKFYDAQGRVDHEVSFEGAVTKYVYDDTAGAGGRLAEKLLFADLTAFTACDPADVVGYSYDAFGRTVATAEDTHGNGTFDRTTTDTYDSSGDLIAVASPEGVIHYEYDAVTGLHTRTWTAATVATALANSTTDTQYSYDTLGRLDAVTIDRRNGTAITPEATDYVYDLLGNLAQERLPNGVVSDYHYDSLNRLAQLREFKDSNSNHSWDPMEPLLGEYDYSLLADGRRSRVQETDAQGQTAQIDWLYDSLGRLTREVYDSSDNALDYAADYVMDLVGNRLAKNTDFTPSSTQLSAYRDATTQMTAANVDEAIASTFDANDRLLTEARDLAGTTDDRFTVYTYGTSNAGTQQTGKVVYQGLDDQGAVVEQEAYSYDLPGQMSQALIDQDGDGLYDQKYDYKYDADGTRVSQTVTNDTDHDGQFGDETPSETQYLNDAQNPTGYTQVLEEKNASGAVGKTYTLGRDVIAQADASSVYYLLKDGHGSTRALVNLGGQIVAGQAFSYDAFGNALGFNPADALTSHLFAGGETDAATGLSYNRYRYWDFATGRFTTLDDPAAGRTSDPLTLHKYLFTPDDPINFNDSSGRMFDGMGATIGLYTKYAVVALNAYGAITNTIASWQDVSCTRASFSENDVWGGIGYCALAVIHAGLAGLSAFGLYKGFTNPPPSFGGGLAFAMGGVGGGGAVAVPRIIWRAIEVSPGFSQWVYTQLVPAIVSNLGNCMFMAAPGGGGLPQQDHHYATNKHSDYTPKLKAIADKYDLDLDGDWNKDLLPHLGRHPHEYHQFVLENMEKAATEAGACKEKFLELFDEYIVKPVTEHPEMLRKAYWEP